MTGLEYEMLGYYEAKSLIVDTTTMDVPEKYVVSIYETLAI